MVKIRLMLLGRHKVPFYRVVLVDSRKKRDGEYLQLFGTFEPKKGVVDLDKTAIIEALQKGAQPSETVLNLLKKQGIYAEFLKTKVNKVKKVSEKKTSKVKKTSNVTKKEKK
ncbi:MAG: 30S ribosomal protein S16 [Mycoplasmataceae bacterium]|jgi:small subunit ribosomal protein S16|nr:30S ribosomal protein S16 [Mycoplasmataceae bacterium]